MEQDFEPTQVIRRELRPNARDFAQVSDFLEALYQWRKKRERGFSYTLWAKELGLQSRVFLKLMAAGKRSITERSIPLFIQGLGLTGAEAEYFMALARLSRATSAPERELQLDTLCRYRKPRARPQPVLDHYKFLSSPLAMRVQAFLTFEREGGWTAKLLAAQLGAGELEVESVLRTLTSLGLARKQGEGWFAEQKAFDVPDQWGSLALQALHRKALEDAIRAIERDPKERRYEKLVAFLTPDELQEFHAEVKDFAVRMLTRFSNRKAAGARLYQAHFSLIPVSEPILQAERSRPVPVGSRSQEQPEEVV